jgi:hypothetical protein
LREGNRTTWRNREYGGHTKQRQRDYEENLLHIIASNLVRIAPIVLVPNTFFISLNWRSPISLFDTRNQYSTYVGAPNSQNDAA